LPKSETRENETPGEEGSSEALVLYM
jgi:hypothetical protein